MGRNKGCLWIGTSGWVYKHWLGIFYPPKMPGSQQLPFYAEHFDSVEVNYSFYRLPPRSVFEGWREQSPQNFLFAVKASRYLTHIKKLKDPEEPLTRLMESATGLGDKLGPVLVQVPPRWHVDLERLQGFLQALRAYPGQQFTMEFRDRSWLVPEVSEMLKDAGVALCVEVRVNVPLDLTLTAPWTYVRVHGGQHGMGLTEEELVQWAGRIRAWREQGVDVYVYFNNDPEGWAIYNGRRLQELTSATVPSG